MSTLTLSSLIIPLLIGVGIIILIYLTYKIFFGRKHLHDDEQAIQSNLTLKTTQGESGSPYLRLAEKEFTIDGMAKQLTFIVESSVPNWEASKPGNEPWVEIRKESNRHLTLTFTSNFSKQAREIIIKISAPVAGKEPLTASVQIIQVEMGQQTEINVTDNLFVFSGETENNIYPEITLQDDKERWWVKSIYTTDGGSWCQVRPAINVQMKGSGILHITTSPKSYNIQNRNAIVTIECGTYPFNSLKHITIMQGVIFSYYIEYPAFDRCTRSYGVIETPLDYKESDPLKEYTIYIHCNLKWRLIKKETDWVTISEPEYIAEKFDGHFNVTVHPNSSTKVKGFSAARHAIISIVTETGLVKDILIYQGGYVVIKGKYWLDRNLQEKHVVTEKAVPIGLPIDNSDTYGTYFQYGNYENEWHSKVYSPNHSWNKNIEEHPIKNVENDPSPEGWRIPTALELKELYSRLNIPTNQYDDFPEDESVNPVNHALHYFTLSSDSGVPVFFPLTGYRSHISGSLMDAGLSGRYWSSTEITPIYAKALGMDKGKSAYITHHLKKHSFPVRCIME